MKKTAKAVAAMAVATALIGTMSVPAFAAGWQKNDTGWWYGTNADNSTWHANGVVQTKSTVTTTNTSRPSSKEFLDYLCRGRNDAAIWTHIDTSKPEWKEGVANIDMSKAVGSR